MDCAGLLGSHLWEPLLNFIRRDLSTDDERRPHTTTNTSISSSTVYSGSHNTRDLGQMWVETLRHSGAKYGQQTNSWTAIQSGSGCRMRALCIVESLSPATLDTRSEVEQIKKEQMLSGPRSVTRACHNDHILLIVKRVWLWSGDMAPPGFISDESCPISDMSITGLFFSSPHWLDEYHENTILINENLNIDGG